MTEEDMEEYCKAIEKYKPDFAYGYMSAMYLLCKFIESRNHPLRHHFKGFLGISESISQEQREYVEGVIGSRVFSFVFERIEGRKDVDVLYNNLGQPISMASLEVHSRIYSYMSRYQFVQDKIGEVQINVVPMPGQSLSIEQLSEIEATFVNRTQNRISFSARSVDAIQPKSNGKLSIVRQNCNPNSQQQICIQ